jgi:hypothetical protein
LANLRQRVQDFPRFTCFKCDKDNWKKKKNFNVSFFDIQYLELFINLRQMLAFLRYQNIDGADLVCGGPRKHKNNFFFKILIQESMCCDSVDQSGLGYCRFY